MDHRLRLFVCFALLCAAVPSPGSAQSLRVVTLNTWSGSDYSGFFAFGTLETAEEREKRFRSLVEELRNLDADVIALQEVNPVHDKAELLAEELHCDVLYLRGNAGIKFGGLGIPWNMNEGLVILAKPELSMRLLDGADFSRGFGVTGNTFAFHFSERDMALGVQIRKDSVEVVIVNVHLSAALPEDPALRSKLRELAGADSTEALARLSEGAQGRIQEVEELIRFLREIGAGRPVILIGDLNATPDSPELALLAGQGGFRDIAQAVDPDSVATWAPDQNPNAVISTNPSSLEGSDADPYERLTAWYDSHTRRIDYILLGPSFEASNVERVERAFDRPRLGSMVSDHYGLMARVDLSGLPRTSEEITRGPRHASLDVLPIAAYDTDVGFGVGLKTFYLNGLGAAESFDLLLFASTGGERLAKLVFSIPDFELRQGTVYPLSFDVAIEYDKYLNNPFFGIGNKSSFDDRETYTKEPIEISAMVGRGLTRQFVLEAGLKFKSVRNYNFADTSLFAATPPALNQGASNGLSFALNARYDSRNSYINPNRGEVVEFDAEYGTDKFLSDYALTKTSLSLQAYRAVITPRTVLALRLSGQVASGDSLPVHTLPWLGGSKTLRGYPMDRYIDKVRLLSTVEVRVPLVWRVGAVVGLDAGKVWDGLSHVDLQNWAWNGVCGLRLYFDTFVARADLGFSREYTGFYLDFGHSF